MFPVLTLLTVESLKLHRKSWKLYLLAKTNWENQVCEETTMRGRTILSEGEKIWWKRKTKHTKNRCGVWWTMVLEYDSRSKPDKSRDEILVYPRSDTSRSWIIDYLQSESKTCFPTRLTLERSKPRGTIFSGTDNFVIKWVNQSSRL